MPLPLILGIGAAIAAAGGLGSGIHGAVKMKEANDTMKSADSRHKENQARFQEKNESTSHAMDQLGSLELKILQSFQDFADVFEKIKNRPQFKTYSIDGASIPEYSAEKLKEVSVGAGVLLGGLGGAALGTAGGFAAAGATTAAVMALGTASTGTAIASLSGVAATNATLAALGGGALAAGGGGIALGTTILGASTLGVGLLIGGVIFNIAGSSLSGKADEAWEQMKRAEREINRACDYLEELAKEANKYRLSLSKVNKIYQAHLTHLKDIVNRMTPVDWKNFSPEDRLCTENTVLLVGLLYNMCQVKMVLNDDGEDGVNEINQDEIDQAIETSKEMIREKKLTANYTGPTVAQDADTAASFGPNSRDSRVTLKVISAAAGFSETGRFLRATVKVMDGIIKSGDSYRLSGTEKEDVITRIGSGYGKKEGEIVDIYMRGNFDPSELKGKTLVHI